MQNMQRKDYSGCDNVLANACRKGFDSAARSDKKAVINLERFLVQQAMNNVYRSNVPTLQGVWKRFQPSAGMAVAMFVG